MAVATLVERVQGQGRIRVHVYMGSSGNLAYSGGVSTCNEFSPNMLKDAIN